MARQFMKGNDAIIVGALAAAALALLQGFLLVKERAWIEAGLAMAVNAAAMALTWWAGWGFAGVALAGVALAFLSSFIPAALAAR